MTITIPLKTFKYLVCGTLVLCVIAAASAALALSKEDIVFPVAELGGCESEQACWSYCSMPDNQPACFGFAKKYNLLPEKEIKRIEKTEGAMKMGGPGGCQGKQECDDYCGQVEHMKECVKFARKHGIRPERELEEMEKVTAALERGVKMPGGCTDKNSCDEYCEDPAHMEECIKFAEKAGFMDERELKDVKKFMPLMKSGQTPGGCKSKRACEAYCDAEGHFEECITFAEKNGLIPKEEAEMARKTGGKGPGGCRGKFECDRFCEKEENMETCFEFGVKHGMIPPEEAEMMKKVGFGPGPGGCKGKQECDAFCDNLDNEDVCFEFALEKGLITQEEIDRIKQMGGPDAFKGPGGCMGPEECDAYCSQEENMEECMQFGPGPDGGPPGEHMGPGDKPHFGGPQYMGPGGCTSPKECSDFCKKPENKQECGKFIPETDEDRREHMRPEDCPMPMIECGPDQARCQTFNERGCPMPKCLPAGSECEPQDGPGMGPRCPMKPMVSCGEGQIMCKFSGPDGCPTSSCINMKEECPRHDLDRGRPNHFGPPPGFDQGPPGQGEFEVPPGFEPPGIDRMENIRRDLEEAKQQGDQERVDKLHQMLGEFERGNEFIPPEEFDEEKKDGLFTRLRDRFRNEDDQMYEDMEMRQDFVEGEGMPNMEEPVRPMEIDRRTPEEIQNWDEMGPEERRREDIRVEDFQPPEPMQFMPGPDGPDAKREEYREEYRPPSDAVMTMPEHEPQEIEGPNDLMPFPEPMPAMEPPIMEPVESSDIIPRSDESGQMIRDDQATFQEAQPPVEHMEMNMPSGMQPPDNTKPMEQPSIMEQAPRIEPEQSPMMQDNQPPPPTSGIFMRLLKVGVAIIMGAQ